MAKLNCSVKNCTNNYDSYCCINEIKVVGAQASASEATCCENFQESEDAFTNNIQTPNINLSINCEATNCNHNSNCTCEADYVDINGAWDYECGETKCSSFSCK
ncbi:DUF1540 domain-containing protein [Clostridium gasigenes]|uniref:DUF1540 domain-containing protein n=1 Tax=Clostridium gasigenes TaxID=94869 RepID=UPI001C0BA93A|nr:DUF1540 domain-containing protein [Clostridium gasigenes]MBU3089053.1 DUF1540 domain-containing protein [Clostridium gasigenes]